MKRTQATGRGDLVASLVLIFPLYLLYAVGVVFSDAINGVDFVSRNVWALCGEDRGRYLLFHGVVALAFVLWIRRTRRARTFSGDVLLPVVLEAAIYALTLSTAIRFLMSHVLEPAGALSLGPTGSRLVASLGAGVHEELVFRLGLCAGGAWLLIRAGASSRLAITLAVIASSLLFSYAHHIGPYGDPFTRDLFAYRALAGVAFALIFYFRSLAHAVYAHALYDVWILVIRPA